MKVFLVCLLTFHSVTLVAQKIQLELIGYTTLSNDQVCCLSGISYLDGDLENGAKFVAVADGSNGSNSLYSISLKFTFREQQTLNVDVGNKVFFQNAFLRPESIRAIKNKKDTVLVGTSDEPTSIRRGDYKPMVWKALKGQRQLKLYKEVSNSTQRTDYGKSYEALDFFKNKDGHLEFILGVENFQGTKNIPGTDTTYVLRCNSDFNECEEYRYLVYKRGKSNIKYVLTSILVYNKNLLTLERWYQNHQSNAVIRVFDFRNKNPETIFNFEKALKSNESVWKTVSKIDNLEGMSWGPRLIRNKNSYKTLVVISDNNNGGYEGRQITQIFLFILVES